MDWVKVPADSKLRRVENIFFPQMIFKRFWMRSLRQTNEEF